MLEKVTQVVAHRGASAQFAENTIEAFVGARALGADWVELDVHRCADGALAVHHDADLPDGPPIASLTSDGLPDHVPLLAAALAACDGMGVNVEVKPHPDLEVVSSVADVIAAWGGPVLVSSFDPAIVQRMRAIAPAVPTALLTFALDDPAATIAACVDAGHAALNPWDPTVTPELVASCHAAGLAVNVWTVDDPSRIAELAAWHVDAIVTNVPDTAKAVLEGIARP